MDTAADEPAADAPDTTSQPAAADVTAAEVPIEDGSTPAEADVVMAVKEEPTLEDAGPDDTTSATQPSLQIRKKAKPTRHGKRSASNDDDEAAADIDESVAVAPSKPFLPAGLFSSHYKVDAPLPKIFHDLIRTA
jgi:hypothetical protein